MRNFCTYVPRLISLLVALVIVCAYVISCAKDEKNGRFDDLYEALSEFYDIQTDTDSADDEKEKTLAVVIPAGCGAKIYDSAVSLAERLSKYAGYQIPLEYDSDFYSKSDVIEILVGATDRDASAEYLKTLRIGEYGYKYLDGALVIGAHTDELCALCVDAFAQAVEQGKVKLSDLEKIEPYELNKEYDVRQIKLCGFDLSEYSIVYPKKNGLSEKAIANTLAKKIAEYSGYSLRVIADNEAKESTRAICVGLTSFSTNNTTEAGFACIARGALTNIELLSDTNAGIYLAAEKLLELIKQSKTDGVCSLEIASDGVHKFSYCAASLSVCAIQGEVQNKLDVYVKLIKQIDLCDLTFFERLSADAIINLRNNGIVLTSFGEGSYFACDTEKIKCVSAERKTSDGGKVTSILFERIADSKRFFVICADNVSQLLADECERYSSYPTVVFCETGEIFSDPHVMAAKENSGIYYSGKNFALEKYSSTKMDDGLNSKSAELNFYYT